MSAEQVAPLKWSAQLSLVPGPPSLVGDKIILPSEALEQLLSAAPHTGATSVQSRSAYDFHASDPHSSAALRHAQSQFAPTEQKLPHPLTFRLVNPANGRVVYAGITEFSAPQQCIGVSDFLLQSLGLEKPQPLETFKDEKIRENGVREATHIESQKITIHFHGLPKGTFAKLRPLEAGYDPDDWKALLESYLRGNFTTLTQGEVVTVRQNTATAFQFLVDDFQPAGDGICIVDTDLEVAIEALNEEQARESMEQYARKHQLAPRSEHSSAQGGLLQFSREAQAHISPGEYIDFHLDSWPRSETLYVDLQTEDDEEDSLQLDLLVSPFWQYQRAAPREDEHVFAKFEDVSSKRIQISPSSTALKNAQSLYVSVHASLGHSSGTISRSFKLKVSAALMSGNEESQQSGPAVDAYEVICSNCRRSIPKQSMLLHEGFCRRNNVSCPFPEKCDRVFQRNSKALQEHWHCDREGCESSGTSSATRDHHMRVNHTPIRCPACPYPVEFPSLLTLAQHRIDLCPGKLILCKFCHLTVPQGGTGDDPFATPDPEVLLSGMTAHEVADGGRTTECHLCSRIVRLRDMETHLKHHDFERRTRSAPRVCRNILCGRTLDGVNSSGDTRSASRVGQGPGNNIDLCSLCFSPLYNSAHDPEGKALRRRVERRYLSQLTSGCGKTWCHNPYCVTGKTHLASDGKGAPAKPLTIGEAMPVIKPYIDGLFTGNLGEEAKPLHFCTDETNQRRRSLASILEAELKRSPSGPEYGWPWCVAALEAGKGDLAKAQEWLTNFAPTLGEET